MRFTFISMTLIFSIFTFVFLTLAASLQAVEQIPTSSPGSEVAPVFANAAVNVPENVPLSHYFAETWDTRDGLPHNSINALAQTPDGYIWAGTWEGVARFNGRKFTLFTRGEETGLPDSGIRSLSLDSQTHELYVAGSRGGVSSVKGNFWQALPAAAYMINFALRVSDGALWLALEDGGVVRRYQGQDLHFLTGASTYHVLEQGDKVWVASSDGLYVYQNGQMQRPETTNNALNGMTYKLALDHNQRLLVGAEQGIWREENRGFKLLDKALKHESVSAVMVDYRGDIWFGTINHGLFRYSEFGLEKLDANVGLPSNRILSLLEDQERSIWIGTNAGLFRLRQAPFTTLSHSRGLSGDYVRTLLSHSDGYLYLGTSNGLNRYQNGRATPLGQRPGAPISVLSLTSASDGGIYVGTYTDGLMYFDGRKLTSYLNRDTGLPSNEVRAVLEQDDGGVWIGTAGGLVHRDRHGQLQFFTDEDGLPGNFIMALSEDYKGRIWVGTGVGLGYFEQGQFYRLSLDEQFDTEYAFGFLMEPGQVWMATDRGLVRYNGETGQLQKVGKEQGLPVDKLFAVVVDEFDYFWLSSNRGVMRVSRASIIASMEQPARQMEYTLFDQGDGMLSSQANGGSQYPAILHNDNNVWVATARGAVMVDPNKLTRMANMALPVSIEAVQFDSHPQQAYQNTVVDVPPEHNRISFTYAGLGYVMTERIEYQTRLLGYEQHWVDRGNLHITEYTNLPPGSYRFEVRARYPYGIWQASGAAVEIKVAPKVWQTLGFKIFVVALLLLLLLLVYRLRFYHLKRSEARLKKRVKEQTQVLAKQAQAFEHQATHDQLTGIANRRAFDQWLVVHFVQAQRDGQPLSLLLLDIDHFKQINDHYSHLVGDQVIATVVQIIARCLPPQALFARWGGEEFTILFPGLDEDGALCWAQRIRHQIASYDYSVLARGLQVSVSIGAADIDCAVNADRLLSHADKALYLAKEQGRNRCLGHRRDYLLCEELP
ncbi:ligand-binding sensor domain-containing diguanylate cyclase [Pseudoalteromonas sp. T1lg76]|uniref:ligand-binding sensor domain-containing diguanylate cyclase n=1 Tax=Pseudoalteromonas sp. T1lg76 TaxID=2077103 RepID=UPI00131A3408|nr:ligand-binding sensor domain-containing diguanylate cyclase [Pseudoalteromonas sp. T1lg76]